MYNDLKENWSYNEWPDVDLEGNVISKSSKKLTESVEVCPECGKAPCECDKLEECGEQVQEGIPVKVCDKCGKILPANDPTACDNMELKEAAEDEEVPVDPVEDPEVADLKSQVRDALDALVPAEGEEELDPHAVIDAVLAYFDNEDAIEYIRSCICPEEEAVEESVKKKTL